MKMFVVIFYFCFVFSDVHISSAFESYFMMVQNWAYYFPVCLFTASRGIHN